MYLPFVARTNFHGLNPARLRERRAEHKVPIHIRATGWKCERLGRLQNYIWLAKLPSFRKFRQSGQILGFPLRFTGLEPRAKQRDLLAG